MSESLIVTLGLQDKGATKQIQALNKEVRFLDKEFKTANKASQAYEKGTESLEKKLDYLNKKYDVNKAKLEAYKKQMGEAKEGVEKKKAELEKLTNAEGDNEKAIERVNNQLNNYESKLKDAERNIKLTEGQLENLNDEIENTEKAIKVKPLQDYAKGFKDLGNNIEAQGQKIKAYGEGMDSLGSKIMGATAPFVALGVAGGKLAMDFEDNIENINTLLDDTTNLEKYKSSIKKFSRDTGIDIETMSSGMYQAISSLGDLGDETNKIFEVMSRSAKAGKAEVSDSVALISAGMKGFGEVNEETARKISDLAFNTAKLGVTTFPEMAKSMQPLFPLANGLGISLEELFGVMATGTGVVGNTSEVTTQFKAVMSNLMKPTTEMSKLIEKYGFASGQAMIESKGLSGVLEILKKETGGSSDKMAKLFSSTEALTLMSALAGSQFDVFNDKLGQMSSAAGATDTAFDKVSSTAKDKFMKSINNLKVSFMEAGEKLTPMVDALSDGIGKLADWIGSLDADTLKNVTTMAMWGMGIGTVLKVGGKLTSTIGSITSFTGKMTTKVGTAIEKQNLLGKVITQVTGHGKSNVKVTSEVAKNVTKLTSSSSVAAGAKGVGALVKTFTTLNPISIGVTASIAAVGGAMLVAKTHTDVMNKSVTTASEDLGFLEKKVASFTGTQFKSRKELEESGIVAKELSSTMSETFKDAINTATKNTNDFNIALSEINLDGVVSEDESNSFVSRVNAMCESAINVINSKSSEQQEALKKFMGADGTLSESELQVLAIMEQGTTNNVNEISYRQDEMIRIVREAQSNNRDLEAEELEAIKQHQQAITQLELQALGSTQEEVLYAKNEFANRVKSMNMEQATAYLQDKKSSIDEETIQIKAGYDTQIELLRGKMETASEDEKTFYQDSINSLIADKENKLLEQQNLWDGYFSVIETNNPALLELINKYNGEEISAAELKSQQMLTTMTGQFAGLEEITKSGSYRMYNEQLKTYQDLEVMIEEKNGNIVGIYNRTNNSVGSVTSEWEKNLKGVAKEQDRASKQIGDALNATGQASIGFSGEIKNSSSDVIGSLQEITRNSDGTTKSIMDLNGEKVEIKTNADGTIKDLQNVIDRINKIPKSKNIDINYRQQTYGTTPSSINNSGRSIDVYSNNQSMFKTPLSTIPSMDSINMPSTYDNMITTPKFFNSSQTIKNVIAKSDSRQGYNQQKSTQGIDVKMIADIIATTIANALENIKIEPVFEATIDGREITSTISNKLAMNTRGLR